MKICKLCGTKLEDDVRFCFNCGADTTHKGAVETVDSDSYKEADARQTRQTNTVPRQPSFQSNTIPPQQENVYYQPSDSNSAQGGDAPYRLPYSAHVYTEKKKRKLPAWAIILIVLACLFVLFIAGIIALGSFGFNQVMKENPNFLTNIKEYISDEASDGESITGGVVNGDTYTNDSVGLAIDVTGSRYRFLNSDEVKDVMEEQADYTEFIFFDETSQENIMGLIVEGSISDVIKDEKVLVREMAEYIFEDSDYPYEIGDAYTMTISGKEFSCIDISQTIDDDEIEVPFTTVMTLCIYKEGSSFYELQFTLYPEETGADAESIVKEYFSQPTE